MFGGMGSRNPQMRYLRLGLLAAVLLAGWAFHDSGPTYTAIRIVYFVVVIGFIAFAFYRRSAARHHDSWTPPTTPPGPGPSPTVPGRPGPPSSPVAHPVTAAEPGAALAPGWYPDQQDMKVQRYWDGSAWVGTRHWEENGWIDG
jgi:hypothetical protein